MQITREDAEKYYDELVNKYYKGEISWNKYKELWDDVELLPYDLYKFTQLKGDTIVWINKLFQKAPETNRRGNFMLRGFTRCEGTEMNLLGLTYGDYADAISFYAYNDEEMLVYEYTEGDTTLVICSDKESYENEKQFTHDWYKEARCA